MIVEPDFLDIKTARFVTSFVTLCIFTKSADFVQLIQTLVIVFGSLWPVLGWTTAVVALYALAGQDIFHSKVVNSEGSAYFDSYASAIGTCFQIFIGENWSAVMYEASDATTEAARLYFISFVTIFSLLLAQLIVSLIVNLFCEISSVSNPKVYDALNKFLTAIDSQDRDADKETVLDVNHKMLPILDICEFLSQKQQDNDGNVFLQCCHALADFTYGASEAEDGHKQSLLTVFVDKQARKVNRILLVDKNPWLRDVISSNDDVFDPKGDEALVVSSLLDDTQAVFQLPDLSAPSELIATNTAGGVTPCVESKGTQERSKLEVDEVDEHNRQLVSFGWYTRVTMVTVLVGIFTSLALWGMDVSFDVINNDKRLVCLHLHISLSRSIFSVAVVLRLTLCLASYSLLLFTFRALFWPLYALLCIFLFSAPFCIFLALLLPVASQPTGPTSD